MGPFTLVVPTLFGLEGICANEMRRLELQEVRADNGRALCAGTAEAVVRANLNLRTGERVLLRVGEFPAPDFDALFDAARLLPWEQFIPREGAFPVKAGHSLDSKLTSIPALQRTIKKAVAERLGRIYHLNTLPETGETYQIQFALRNDQMELFLDSSGVGLHKRGYRARGVDAPLRETLAAGLVLLSRYRGKGPLRDPFCGSGTIPIEAAYLAKNRAPGLDRDFPARRWEGMGKLWREEADRARALEYRGDYDILGTDVDPGAIDLARDNARKAGVADAVRFQVADARRFAPSEERGRVVTNPPYGERLMERREAEELYAAFGRAWRAVPPGWTLSLLSSHTEFERTFGKKADHKRKLYNGMLRCDLFQYE